MKNILILFFAFLFSVMQLGREQVAVYKENIIKFNRLMEGSCASITDIKKMEEEVKSQEIKLLAFEKFRTDTLPFLRQNLNYEVTKIIQSEIKEYGKLRGIKLILDANEPYFHITKTEDITYSISFQLKQKYNLPQHKLARRQAVQRVKEKYKLNQDLRKRFSYAILNKNSR